MFYFRGRSRAWFKGKFGLDAGACICRGQTDAIFRRCRTDYERSLLLHTGVPHFQYYSDLGSAMSAIDVRESIHKAIRRGDIRFLEFSSASFHFLTIAMILGPAGPCRSFLDAALALTEVNRVLRPGGVAYIADVGFQPCLGYMAEQFGFAVFASKGSSCLPIGTFLQKRASGGCRTSDELVEHSCVTPLSFGFENDEVFENCNLLFDTEHVLTRRDHRNNARYQAASEVKS
jgi:Methylase involved in ubiquinone/menaquinone biosynthesis